MGAERLAGAAGAKAARGQARVATGRLSDDALTKRASKQQFDFAAKIALWARGNGDRPAAGSYTKLDQLGAACA